MVLDKISEYLCFEGLQQRFSHYSEMLKCKMNFSIYLPPEANSGSVPVVYWLSGLTCTDENFVQKAGAQRYASELGIALVAPDTSPRGDNVPDDPLGEYDFGLGAGFYVNATETPWSDNYQMYDYVSIELPRIMQENFPVDPGRESIMGHSMGGHGALITALKNPGQYNSVSAFSPIVAPVQVPWGEKAFSQYLGQDRKRWKEYDACELIMAGSRHLPMLVDQGEADEFLGVQLRTELLELACKEMNFEATIRYQSGYDHSYFFIGSLIGCHLRFHQRWLG
jgi:S-formylglutathione hydrolase